MAHRKEEADEELDEQDDEDEAVDESPLESDVDPDEDEDEPAVVPCPYCGEDIYEEVQRCAHCGKYVSSEDAPARPRSSGWVTALLFLLLVAALAGALVYMR